MFFLEYLWWISSIFTATFNKIVVIELHLHKIPTHIYHSNIIFQIRKRTLTTVAANYVSSTKYSKWRALCNSLSSRISREKKIRLTFKDRILIASVWFGIFISRRSQEATLPTKIVTNSWLHWVINAPRASSWRKLRRLCALTLNESHYERHYRRMYYSPYYRNLKFRSCLAPAAPRREIMRAANRSLACGAAAENTPRAHCAARRDR